MDDLDTTPVTQYVYLDFDGERTTYRNRDLNVSLSVTVKNSGFSSAQKQEILSGLTEKYKSDGVVFTTEKPKDTAYSTLYFGQSSSFRKYGDFFGISETIDGNNQTANDNAFILLDSAYSTDQVISVAAKELDNLLGNTITVDRKKVMKDYAASTYLLSTEWNQRDPYNQYCPVDPGTKQRSLTGCTNTAAAQIVYYWIKSGYLDFSLSLDASDSYTENGITISAESRDVSEFDYLSFSETNKLLSNFKLDNSKCIAALCFAAGVVQQASYGSESTSTAWSASLFTRSGFRFNLRHIYTVGRYIQDNHKGLTASGYNLMVSELLAGRPVGASLNYANGKKEGVERHSVIVDGYNSATNEFHVNFGWGGKSDGWYSMDSLNDDYGIDELIVGITPAVAPCLSVTKLSFKSDTVNWSDDIVLNCTISNKGTEKSAAATAYVYSGETLLVSADVAFISAGCSRSFSCTVNASLLPFGSSELTVKVNSQDRTGSVSSLSRTIRVYDDAVTNADDTWQKAAEAGSWTKIAAEYDLEGVMADTVISTDEYVGFYDYRDFRVLSLEHPGKYTFTLSGIDHDLGISVYALAANNRLKLLKSRVISGSKGGGMLADVPLERGTYYVAVTAVNWKKHGDSKYTLSVSGEGYLKGDNQDDWNAEDLKNGVDEGVPCFGSITDETVVVMADGWVGLGDEIDYKKITLEKAAKLSFSLSATDEVEFTIARLVKKAGRNGTVTYSLKKLQTAKLKKNNHYTAESTPILLEADDYYISMKSTNAAKGASTDYNVLFGEQSVKKFYLDCDDGGNNWLYDKGLGGWNDTVLDSVAFAFDSKTAIQVDDDVLGHKDGEKAYANFVGFGDAMDVRKIELAHAAKLSFSVEHTGGKAKFILYRINEKGRMVAVIPGKTFKSGGSTAEKVLEKGVYYIAVQSAGAKNGDEVYYDVNVDGTFYNDGDAGTNDYLWTRSDGWNEAVVNSTAKALAAEAFQVDADVLNVKRGGTVYTNFVGTGDTGDVVKIQAAAGMTVCFNVEATDAVSFVIYERVFKNNRYSQKVLQTTNLTAKNGFRNDAVMYTFKNDGDFYVGVMSANAKKGSEAYYNVEIASVVNSSAASLDAPVSAGLAMEEASASLDLAGELSPVQYAADTPADIPAALALDPLNGKSAWPGIATLA